MKKCFFEILGSMLISLIAGIAGVALIVVLDIPVTGMQGGILIGGVIFILFATQEIGKGISYLKKQRK